MNLRKIILSIVFVWLSGVGYLTWYNGLKSTGRYKGFNWEEWIWFGLVPVLLSTILYFIWKSLFSATVNYDLASAEGMKPNFANLFFYKMVCLIQSQLL